jgi:hypothetical protein
MNVIFIFGIKLIQLSMRKRKKGLNLFYWSGRMGSTQMGKPTYKLGLTKEGFQAKRRQFGYHPIFFGYLVKTTKHPSAKFVKIKNKENYIIYVK